MNSILDFLQPTQFSDALRLAVWQKAIVDPGQDATLIRKDACGAWIKWAGYGNTTSDWGWEIDHIIPVSLGGSNNIENLQALHWQNNRAKGNNTVLACPVTSAS